MRMKNDSTGTWSILFMVGSSNYDKPAIVVSFDLYAFYSRLSGQAWEKGK